MVCRQLGLALPGRVVRNGAFGLGSGPVFTSDLQCSGEEEEIGACLHGFYGNSLGCSPAEAAAIECGYKPPASKAAGGGARVGWLGRKVSQACSVALRTEACWHGSTRRPTDGFTLPSLGGAPQ